MNGQYILGDCMDYLPAYEDNHFDLAIVDPPYGIHKRLLNGRGHMKNSPQRVKYQGKQWDKKQPSKRYFEQLLRVSKNAIIWGGNFFNLPASFHVIAWVKPQMKNHPHFSQFELAWTTFDKSNKCVYCNVANSEGSSIHPTQKPKKLYKWLLKNYGKEGDLILDTHVGSASSLIACEDMGFTYVGYEKDPDYYRDSMKRLKQHIAQLKIF